MCKKEKEKCEFKDDSKGCALKHISKARELLSKGDVEGADLDINDLSIMKRLIKDSKLFKKVGTGKRDMHVTSVLRQIEDLAKKLADKTIKQSRCLIKERKS